MKHFITAVTGLLFTAGFGYLAFHGDGGFGSFLWGCVAAVAMFMTMASLTDSTVTIAATNQAAKTARKSETELDDN